MAISFPDAIVWAKEWQNMPFKVLRIERVMLRGGIFEQN